jgi:hypothetical protein
MTDLTFLTQYIDIVTLGICLCVGFVIKQAFNWMDNKYIPLSMLVLGTIIAVVTHLEHVNAAVILGGMISGLSSTGLYEMLRNLVDKDGNKSTIEGE